MCLRKTVLEMKMSDMKRLRKSEAEISGDGVEGGDMVKGDIETKVTKEEVMENN